MNIIDALKTERPLRRAGDEHWWNPTPANLVFLTRSAILAEDWEVEEVTAPRKAGEKEEETVTISRGQLADTIFVAFYGPNKENTWSDRIRFIAKKLGFKE